MEKLKQYIRPLSYLLTIAALIYIGTIVAKFDWTALNFTNPIKSTGYIALFGVWSALMLFIFAYNWQLILEFIHGSAVKTKDIFRVYLTSNVAKYLPGNMLHYAGRNYLGNKLGWKNADMAFSSFLEFFFGVGMTALILILFIALDLIALPPHIALKINYHKVLAYSAAGVLTGIVLVIGIYVYRYVVRKEQLRQTSEKLLRKARLFTTRTFMILFVKLFVISLCCFILNSLFYYYLCDLVLDFHIKPEDMFNVFAALSIANYSGIITPGVPSGFGVKESVSFLLISAYGYPKEVLMVSILAYRIACVLGDFLPLIIVNFIKEDYVTSSDSSLR